ncbi:hypothetical protein ADUPG1_002928, partial [Aduncisulcus paluster]
MNGVDCLLYGYLHHIICDGKQKWINMDAPMGGHHPCPWCTTRGEALLFADEPSGKRRYALPADDEHESESLSSSISGHRIDVLSIADMLRTEDRVAPRARSQFIMPPSLPCRSLDPVLPVSRSQPVPTRSSSSSKQKTKKTKDKHVLRAAYEDGRIIFSPGELHCNDLLHDQELGDTIDTIKMIEGMLNPVQMELFNKRLALFECSVRLRSAS